MFSSLTDAALSSFRLWVSWFAVGGSAIGVICAILTIATGKETARRDALRIANLGSRLQAAQEDTRAARELAEKVQQESLPRVLGVDQRAKLIQSLKGVSKGKVTVKANMFDTEAESYARSISAALVEAGFDVADLPYSGIVSLNQPGLYMLVRDLESPPPQAGPIQKCFENVGTQVLALVAPHAEFPSDMVVIWVSRKMVPGA